MNRALETLSLIQETRYYQPKINVVNATDVENQFVDIAINYGKNKKEIRNWLLYKVMPAFINNEEGLLKELKSRDDLIRIAKLRSLVVDRLIKQGGPYYCYVNDGKTNEYFDQLKHVVVALVDFYKNNPGRSREIPNLGVHELYAEYLDSKELKEIQRYGSNLEPYFKDEEVVEAINSADTIVKKEVCIDLVGSKKLLMEGKIIPEPYALLADTVMDQHNSVVGTLVKKSGSYKVSRQLREVRVDINYDGAIKPIQIYINIDPIELSSFVGRLTPADPPLDYRPNKGQLPHPIYTYGQLLSTILYDWGKGY